MLNDVDLARPWEHAHQPSVNLLDVFYFFRHVLGRTPSEHEWATHQIFLGQDLREVVGTYLNSPEFKARKLVGYAPQGVQRVELGGYHLYAAGNDLAVGAHIIRDRQYEPGVSDAFRRLLQPGMTVVDVGGNIGWYSLLSASLVGSSGRVIAFEPGVINGRFLELNKASNGFDQITIFHTALSDRVETLAYASQFSNGIVSKLTDVETEAVLSAEMTQAVPLDLMIPDDLQVHLIKIDVEGWEMKVLRGAARVLRRWRPQLVIEFTPPSLEAFSKVTGEAFLQSLVGFGYGFTAVYDAHVVPMGQDVARVMQEFHGANATHIDILCEAV